MAVRPFVLPNPIGRDMCQYIYLKIAGTDIGSSCFGTIELYEREIPHDLAEHLSHCCRKWRPMEMKDIRYNLQAYGQVGRSLTDEEIAAIQVELAGYYDMVNCNRCR